MTTKKAEFTGKGTFLIDPTNSPIQNPDFAQQKLANQLILSWANMAVNFIKNEVLPLTPATDFSYDVKSMGQGYIFTVSFNGGIDYQITGGDNEQKRLAAKSTSGDSYTMMIRPDDMDSLTTAKAEDILKTRANILNYTKKALKAVKFTNKTATKKAEPKKTASKTAPKKETPKKQNETPSSKLTRFDALLHTINIISRKEKLTNVSAEEIINQADNKYHENGGTQNKAETTYYYKQYETIQNHLKTPAVTKKAKGNRFTRLDAVCKAYDTTKSKEQIIKDANKIASKKGMEPNEKETETKYKLVDKTAQFFLS